VTGMTCGHCVASVTEEVSEVPGVTHVHVVLETGLLSVTTGGTGGRRRNQGSRRAGWISSLVSVPVKLLAFLGGLVVVFVGAFGVGRTAGPLDGPAPAGHEGMAMGDDMSAAMPTLPKGLMVSQNGYTLRLAQATLKSGPAVPVTFTIEGPDGTPVTQFDVEHEKQLHFIAVRRDFSGFQHVHPVMDNAGTWTTALSFTPGQWRLFADFKPAGADALTLGNDVSVPGDYEPVPAPAEDALTATVDDYTVN